MKLTSAEDELTPHGHAEPGKCTVSILKRIATVPSSPLDSPHGLPDHARAGPVHDSHASDAGRVDSELRAGLPNCPCGSTVHGGERLRKRLLGILGTTAPGPAQRSTRPKARQRPRACAVRIARHSKASRRGPAPIGPSCVVAPAKDQPPARSALATLPHSSPRAVARPGSSSPPPRPRREERVEKLLLLSLPPPSSRKVNPRPVHTPAKHGAAHPPVLARLHSSGVRRGRAPGPRRGMQHAALRAQHAPCI